MKILLTIFFDPQDLGSRHLAAYMKSRGHEVRIVALKSGSWGKLAQRPDKEEVNKCMRVSSATAGISFLQQADISEHELELLTNVIQEWQPDIMGFGTRSKNFAYLPKVIPAMRKGAPNAFLIAGGFGPSLEPHIPLNMGVDAVLRGEGEYILEDLANAISENISWKDIPGIAYIESDKIKINPVRPQEKNLDNFPFPFCDERDIVFIDNDKIAVPDKNSSKLWSTSSYIILTSRGCIEECSYCGGRVLRDKFKEEGTYVPRIRRRSLSNVLEELLIAKENNPNIIVFIDEFFVHPVKESIQFFINYKKLIDLPFFAHISADQIVKHPDLLYAAADAGWYNFVFGLQAGNEKFCKEMYNRRNNNKNLLKAISICRDKYMSGYIYMILGNPLEDEIHLNDSLDFARELPSFDPSFKQRIFFETSKLSIPYGNVPLKLKYPQLLNLKFPNSQFYYDAMMLEFRLVLDDYDFNELRQNKLYKNNSYLLGDLYHNTIQRLHTEYITKELARINGKEVYIYGGGASYETNKNLLSHLKIKNIILDTRESPEEIDGHKVIQPYQASFTSETPIIIMARPQNINAIYRKLKNNYLNATDIIGCAKL